MSNNKNKTHIDENKFIEEQLKNLSEEQQEQLRNWWEPKIGQEIAGFWLNEYDCMDLMYFGVIKDVTKDDYNRTLINVGGSIIWYKGNCLPILTIAELEEVKKELEW